MLDYPTHTVILSENPLELLEIPVHLVAGEHLRIDLVINVEAEWPDLPALEFFIDFVMFLLTVTSSSIFVRGLIRLRAVGMVGGAVT
jgi:hypothetical protein